MSLTSAASTSSVPYQRLAPKAPGKVSAFFKKFKISLNNGGRKALSFFSCGCYQYRPTKIYRALEKIAVAPMAPPAAFAPVDAGRIEAPFSPSRTVVVDAVEKKVLAGLRAMRLTDENAADDPDLIVIDDAAIESIGVREKYIDQARKTFEQIRKDIGEEPVANSFFEWYFQAFSDVLGKMEAESYQDSCNRVDAEEEFLVVESKVDSRAEHAYRSLIGNAWASVFDDLLTDACAIPKDIVDRLRPQYASIFEEKRRKAVWQLALAIPTFKVGSGGALYCFTERVAAEYLADCNSLNDVQRNNLLFLARKHEKTGRYIDAALFDMAMTTRKDNKFVRDAALPDISCAKIFAETANELLGMARSERREAVQIAIQKVEEIDMPFDPGKDW